jgi:hypothetical protein
MLLMIWITLFAIAAVTTGLTISRRLPGVIGALGAILLWVVVAFGALQLEVVSGGSIIMRDPNQPLAFLGLAGIVLNLIFALADATNQLPDSGPTAGREMEQGGPR